MAVTVRPEDRPRVAELRVPWEEPRSTHSVQFYDDDNYLIDDLSLYIGATLVAGDSAVVIATPGHREMLAARISASGLDLRRVVRQGRFFSLDARQTLETFMDRDMPDPTRFAEVGG